jgi:hypothetical protein
MYNFTTLNTNMAEITDFFIQKPMILKFTYSSEFIYTFYNIPKMKTTNLNKDNKIKIENQESFKLLPKSVKKWYCVNCAVKNNICIPIPVGTATRGTDNPLLKEVIKQNIIRDKYPLVFIRFTMNSRARQLCVDKNKNNPICTTLPAGEGLETLQLNAKHIFTACPIGWGADCLRIWETLTLGGIPILDDVPEMRQFEDLPVIYTKDWNLTSEWLLGELEHLKARDPSVDKVRMSYWDSKVRSAKEYIFNSFIEEEQLIYKKTEDYNMLRLKLKGGRFKLL